MWYNFHRLFSLFVISVLTLIFFVPVGYFNYILGFNYDFNWGIIIIASVLESIVIINYVLRPVYTRMTCKAASGELKKKFILHGRMVNDLDPSGIKAREVLLKQMLVRGVNEFSRMNFGNLDLTNIDLRNAKFSYCLFNNCNLTNARLERTVFDSCIFEKTDFTNAVLKNATITGLNLRFNESIMTNTNLDNTKIVQSVPNKNRIADFWFSELEKNKVTGIEEIKEKYVCQDFYKRSLKSFDSFLILPRYN